MEEYDFKIVRSGVGVSQSLFLNVVGFSTGSYGTIVVSHKLPIFFKKWQPNFAL